MRTCFFPAVLAISILSAPLDAARSGAQHGAVPGYGKPAGPVRNAVERDYEVTRIPLPADAIGGVAAFVNNTRTVSGTYFTAAGKETTFLYSKGQLERIAKPGADIASVPSVADGGQIFYGNWGTLTHQQAGTYNRKTGEWKAFPDIPGKPLNVGWVMNNSGRAIGEACEGLFNNPTGCINWFWNGSQYEFLTFPGLAQTQIRGLNDKGQISGSYLLAPPFDVRSFLFEDGTLIPLFDNTDSSANGINDQSQVLLMLELSPVELFRPALYDAGEVTMLPLYPASLQTSWIGLNERGDMAGIYFNSFNEPPQPVVAWITRNR